VKDEQGHLLANSHNIFNSYKSYFSQIWNVYRQIEIHTVELLVPDHSPSEFEIAIPKLKKYK
jgi:hypothetical protein